MMSNIRTALLAAAAMLVPTAAQAELKVYTFVGIVNTAYDPNSATNLVGTTFTGRFSYDPANPTGALSTQESYALSDFSFTGAVGAASGSGSITITHQNYSDNVSYFANLEGSFYLVSGGTSSAATPPGSPGPELGGKTFSIGAQARNGKQFNGTFTVNALSAVPEPASWALMIGGFGVVGGAMRRQRVRAAVRFA